MPPENEKKRLRVEIANISEAWSTWRSLFGWDTWAEADAIIRTKGQNLFGYYDKMIDSDGVLAGLIETRTDAVAGLEWEVLAAGEEDADQEMAAFVRFALRRVHNLQGDLSELLGACRTGFSISEVVWEEAQWEGKTVLVPGRILSKPPDWFRFTENRELRFRTRKAPVNGEAVPPYKFIHHVFRTRYENPYGTSLLRAAYWPWWFKHHGFGEWMKACERGAVGSVVVKYPAEITNEQEINEFGQAAEALLKSKWMTIRDTCELLFPEVKIDPSFADTLVARCNTEMTYRVLGGTLSSGTAESGTRALGEVHDERFQERKEADSQALAGTLNSQLVRWIVEVNFGEMAEYPEWKQRYERRRDLKQAGESLKVAAAIGIPVSVRTAADLLELPLAEEGEELIHAPQQAGGPFPGPAGGGDGEKKDGGGEDGGPDQDDEDEGGDRDGGPSRGGIMVTAAGAVLTRARSNFDNAENLFRGALKYGMPRYRAIASQIEDWLGQFDTISEALEAVDDFAIDSSDLVQCLRDIIFFDLLHGAFALFDLPAVRKALGLKPLGAWRRMYLRHVARKWIPVPPEAAIALFEDREVLERAEFDLLEAVSRRQALTSAGMTAETIASRLRPALQEALEEGVFLDDFIGRVGEVCLSAAHAENVFRTNVMGAYNSGHAEALYYAPLAHAIPAFQFLAVLDDRTTEICAERDGQVYTRDDLVGIDVVPPCHYQCRSCIIGVFADEWNGRSSDAPALPAQQGFGRWKPVLGE